MHFTWNTSPCAIRGPLQVGGLPVESLGKSLGAFLHVLCLINVPGGMTSFPKRSPPRLQSQSNSKQVLALCYSTMFPLWIVEVFKQRMSVYWCFWSPIPLSSSCTVETERHIYPCLTDCDRLISTRRYAWKKLVRYVIYLYFTTHYIV